MDEAGYDAEMDRAVADAEARLAEEDEMFAAQLADMIAARGLAWVLIELAVCERELACRRLERELAAKGFPLA